MKSQDILSREIHERIRDVVVDNRISREAAALKIANIIEKANEAIFRMTAGLNDMGVFAPDYLHEYYEAMDDLDVPRV